MIFMAFGFLAAKARQEYYLRMVTCVMRVRTGEKGRDAL